MMKTMMYDFWGYYVLFDNNYSNDFDVLAL